jgi:hypothetical protein
MDYYPAAASFFPESYADQFYVALSGNDGIMRLRFGLENRRLLSMPEFFFRNKGDQRYNAGAWPLVLMAFTLRPCCRSGKTKAPPA